MKELDASPTEETDLLIKWLGLNSRRQAISLRAAYITDPPKGLELTWKRLDERYGAPEIIDAAIKEKLHNFPRLTPRVTAKLYELTDILAEIEAIKDDPKFHSLLSYYDSSAGIIPIVSKLPYGIQERWTKQASGYKQRNGVPYPPFYVFCDYMRETSRIKNDPSFMYTQNNVFQPERRPQRTPMTGSYKPNISTSKTQVNPSGQNTSEYNKCPLHGTNHALQTCRGFRSKPLEERKRILKQNGSCFRCCDNKHMARSCKTVLKCTDCGSSYHPTALHPSSPTVPTDENPSSALSTAYGGEKEITETIENKCTQICEDGRGKSCAKLVLVNIYCTDNQENQKHVKSSIKCYAIIDEQSNRSLVKPELFSLLGISSKNHEYSLNSCAGTIVTSGRKANNCIVESIDGSVRYTLPTLIKCSDIPNNRHEICSPKDAYCHPHLYKIADCIPDIDENADILLLLGRDIIEVHHVLDQVVGPPGAPFAQRLGLGWVVIGELCLGQIHSQDTANVYKTHVLSNGRTSLFKPCDSKFSVEDNVYDPVFVKTVDDDKPSLSIEDGQFLEIMDRECLQDSGNHWIAPLPFKVPRSRLPNNKEVAVKRAKSLDFSLKKNPVKKQHFVEFMDKIFSNGHAEIAPKLDPDEECWYLPIFGVYHPQKPNQIRGVFDSSAELHGMSLNSVLLQGPDLANSLLGVLMRFRRERVAVVADIEQMFYCFGVSENQRNFLRFLWYRDNDPDKPLIEFRMCKHVFGNSPSPAIATYGHRKCVDKCDDDVKDFVSKDFYVDDGLTSRSTAPKVVDLLERTRSVLGSSGLRLHKIASNDPEVMKCFSQNDLAKDLKNLDFVSDDLPTQRSLGIGWDLKLDAFVFKVRLSDQPFTKRGILSVINSVFDPIGFLAPVVIVGKLILRDLVSLHGGWDEPVPPDFMLKWVSWRDSLHNLMVLQINRSYFNGSVREMSRLEFHVFSDASERAIAAVVYVVGYTDNGERQVSFVLGKAKVAPTSGHTIPRLELCAAVLAVDIYRSVVDNLEVCVADTKFYTDSKVVLGYIYNQSRRFFTYVSNRVQKIRHLSNPGQWNYVPSESNPADIGSRGIGPLQLQGSPWLCGPSFIVEKSKSASEPTSECFPLLVPEQNGEVRCNVSVLATKVEVLDGLGCSRFERFSSWKRLVYAMSHLRHIVLSYQQRLPCKGWHLCTHAREVEFRQATELFILKEVQQKAYHKEMACLLKHQKLDSNSPILTLDPYLDADGLLRVHGRLSRSSLSVEEKHPVIMPGKHHISKLLVYHYHESVFHQGRHFTEGAVRSAGFWITGGKRLVSSIIFSCVPCKKLRGVFSSQKMSDLPVDRIKQAHPFSYVGVDVFGPWSVVTRRTRGGQAASKRWAVMFTCMSIRAVHIEVIEDLSSSSFINALRRFIAVRGKVKQFRSDRGTNCVGATDSINVEAINVEDEKTQSYLRSSDSTWLFNAPHSSQLGGSWERMIGVTRRILESMLSNVKTLTHDVFVTLMAEVSATINARPIVPVSTDVEEPEVLSPSALLTHKLQCDQQPVGDMDVKNLYKDQWKRVQFLADQFWSRWSREYLHTLQKRRKWNFEQESVQVDDIVFLRDSEVVRNCWPLGRVSRVFPSEDGRVRKAEVCIIKDGKQTSYVRPIVDLVLLVRK